MSALPQRSGTDPQQVSTKTSHSGVWKQSADTRRRSCNLKQFCHYIEVIWSESWWWFWFLYLTAIKDICCWMQWDIWSWLYIDSISISFGLQLVAVMPQRQSSSGRTLDFTSCVPSHWCLSLWTFDFHIPAVLDLINLKGWLSTIQRLHRVFVFVLFNSQSELSELSLVDLSQFPLMNLQWHPDPCSVFHVCRWWWCMRTLQL